MFKKKKHEREPEDYYSGTYDKWIFDGEDSDDDLKNSKNHAMELYDAFEKAEKRKKRKSRLKAELIMRPERNRKKASLKKKNMIIF